MAIRNGANRRVLIPQLCVCFGYCIAGEVAMPLAPCKYSDLFEMRNRKQMLARNDLWAQTSRAARKFLFLAALVATIGLF